MCYHYGFAKQKPAIEKRFKVDVPEKYAPLFHVSAFGAEAGGLPVISNASPERVEMMKWGLVPAWSKESKLKYSTQNAMSESVFEKPAYRSSIPRKRCLVIADGFYEWQDRGGKKIPHWIQQPGGDLFAFAGIWEEWVNRESGEILHSFSILTKAANPFMAEIHNVKKRMPVILNPDQEQVWLSDIERNEIETVLATSNQVPLEAWTISKDVLKSPPQVDLRQIVNY